MKEAGHPLTARVFFLGVWRGGKVNCLGKEEITFLTTIGSFLRHFWGSTPEFWAAAPNFIFPSWGGGGIGMLSEGRGRLQRQPPTPFGCGGF